MERKNRLISLMGKKQEMIDSYGEAIRKIIEIKTGLKFPIDWYSDRNILFLERFIRANNIADAKKLWMPFKRDYEKISKEIYDLLGRVIK